MVDLDRHYDVEKAVEAARRTGLDMIALAEMIRDKRFDIVVAAHLIKASRDRLEPFAELKVTHPSPNETGISKDWMYRIAMRLPRNLYRLTNRLKSIAESESPDRMRQWKRDLLHWIISSVIDLRGLLDAPDMQKSLMPDYQRVRVINPSSTDAN